MAKRRSSKSPARAASGGGGFDFNDDNVQNFIALGVVLGLVFLKADMDIKGVDHNSILGFFGDDGDYSHAFWPYGGLFLTLHVLNCVQGHTGGNWAGDFVGATIAAFGGWMASDVLNHQKQRILTDETTCSLVFVCWYLSNHNIPMTEFNVWEIVSGFGGAALSNLMTLASTMFTTNLILGAAAVGGKAGPFNFAIFGAVAAGVVAGCAGDFFPVSKGINISGGAAFERAALISVFIATDGFATLPFVGNIVGPLVANVAAFAGGNAGLVRACTLINHFFGSFIPIDPVEQAVAAFHNFSGLGR